MNSIAPSDFFNELTELVCPGCHQRLECHDIQSFWTCDSCDEHYPMISTNLPVIVPDPSAHLAGERSVGEHFASQYSAVASQYALRSKAGGKRAAHLMELSSALTQNSALLQNLFSEVPALTDVSRGYSAPLGGDLFAALRRDWSGEEEAEEELGVIRDCVLELIDDQSKGTALMLGAGTGRTLSDLCARIPSIIGIDLSIGMGLIYGRLTRGEDITASQLLNGNYYRTEDECQRFVASHRHSPHRAAYLVADATQLPFGDNSVGLVISINFSDVVPMSQLLPELRRVLRPGGKLLHFGPLGYVFDDFGEHYAVDQIPEVWADYGFRVQHQDTVVNTHFADSRRMTRLTMDNLRMMAELIE